MEFLYIYFASISIITAGVTIYDKIASKKLPRRRVRENTLIMLAIFGGSIAEYLTMLIIRHKTRHNKFMLGLPLIFAVQTAAVCAVNYCFFR